MSSSQQAVPLTSAAAPPPQPATIATSDAAKPREKARRDECMLFSKAADPAADCQSTVEQYRTCMAGFGFKV